MIQLIFLFVRLGPILAHTFEKDPVKRDDVAATRVEILPFPACKQQIQSTVELMRVEITTKTLKPIALIKLEDFKDFLMLLKLGFKLATRILLLLEWGFKLATRILLFPDWDIKLTTRILLLLKWWKKLHYLSVEMLDFGRFFAMRLFLFHFEFLYLFIRFLEFFMLKKLLGLLFFKFFWGLL